MILIYIFKFLTIWSFFLSLFHNYVNSYISLPFLSFICMIMGLYISYINPKKYVIYNYNKPIEIKNNLIKLLFIDIPFCEKKYMGKIKNKKKYFFKISYSNLENKESINKISNNIHLSRAIARRCERKMVDVNKNYSHIDDNCLIFINRLSDYLFMLARYESYKKNGSEIIYKKSSILTPI